ncbi:MAG: sugar phosphate isomerase/epimerase family protein [Trueperaceae bacterium]
MKLGYSSATAGISNLEEAFRFADSLRLDFIELNYDTCDFLPHAQPAKSVNTLVRNTGISVTVHLPFVDTNIASLMPAIRRASVEQTLRGLEYAHAVNAGCAVLHTGKVFIYQPVPFEDAHAALHMSLSELHSQVPIALENLALFPDGLVREPEMLRDFTRAAGLGNCLDFGHAHIESWQPWRDESVRGEDMVRKYIDTLGGDIIHLHLCNNNGKDDLHTATDKGTIPYERYADFLEKFNGTICLEVAGGKEQVRRSAEHICSLIAVLS